VSTIRFLQDYSKVLLIVDGKCVATIPAKQAVEAGHALRHVGARAQEWEEAQRLIEDQAIMIRTGAPFSLTGDPKLNAEAFKEAQWNSELRRYIPAVKPIQSAEKIGRAKITVERK